MSFDHVVFDLDGTLIDSYRDIARALNETLRSLGCAEHDPEEVKTMIGHGVAVLLERGLGSGDPELLQRARARFRDEYAKRLLETTRPYDGVVDVLRALAARGVRTSVATNKPSYFTTPIVEGLRLRDAGLLAFACADEAGPRKPDPRVVRLALERAGAPPGARLAYVGDMPVDAETAAAVPCPFVGVSWGFDPRRIEGRTDFWAVSPASLLQILGGAA